MTPEMEKAVEAMAAAMHEHNRQDDEPTFEKEDPTYRQVYLDQTERALRALLEHWRETGPSEGMIETGRAQLASCDFYLPDTFKAMLSTALQDLGSDTQEGGGS